MVFRNHTQGTRGVHNYLALVAPRPFEWTELRNIIFLKIKYIMELLIQFSLNFINLTRTWVLIPALLVTCRTNDIICNNFQPSIMYLKNEINKNICTLSIKKKVVFGLSDHIEILYTTQHWHIWDSPFGFIICKSEKWKPENLQLTAGHSISY